MFTSTQKTAQMFLLLCVAAMPVHAAVFSENLLGLDEASISNVLKVKGYDVRADVKNFNYTAKHKTSLGDYLDGGFTLCKGKTISVVIGIDANADYEDQLKILLKQFGQPIVTVLSASLRDGDTSYVDLEWELNGQRINLQSYPPSKLWKTPTATRTALLTFQDLKQDCYFVPPRVKNPQ